MKVPRKVLLNESAPFFNFFRRFWDTYWHDFEHINLENILFLKDEVQNTVPHKRYMEIKIAPRELQLAIPKIKFVLVVYQAFNFISNSQRDYEFYNCLFRVPKDYLKKTYLKKPDFIGFVNVMDKFKGNKDEILYGVLR